MSDRDLHYGSTSKNRDLLPLVISVVDACNYSNAEDQKKLAECLDRAWIGSANTSKLVKYFTSKKRSSDGGPLRSLLRALEACTDDFCLLTVCRLVQDFLFNGSSKARRKRHQRLIKADATSALLRTMRYRLKDVASRKLKEKNDEETNPLAYRCDDTVATLVLAVGAKDCRLSLKIRVSGVLQMLCSLVAGDFDDPLSLTTARLLCRSLRSPRNAQLAGRHRGFATSLLLRISSLEGKDAGQCLLLARYLEVLYFIAKNRKTRAHLVDESVIVCVVPLLERHFWWRQLGDQDGSTSASDAHSEICLISIALLRLLSNNKRAKEQLISCKVLELCERIMDGLENEGLAMSPAASHLQDSLCALCLRCLPTFCFPIAGKPFPFKYKLQRVASPTKKRQSSKSPQKRCADSLSDAVADRSIDVDDVESSDDDGGLEEDEVFAQIGEGEDFAHEIEEESEDVRKEITHTQLKTSELEAYAGCFSEYQNGASAKHPTALAPYEKAFLQNAQTTRSVIPFAKIAFPEIQNSDVDVPRQPLCDNRTSMREVVVHEIARARASNEFRSRVVYDLDIFANEEKTSRAPMTPLSNGDSRRVGIINSKMDHLQFESRFECGNLRRATQVGPTHYELILSPDINQKKEHYQWFYFEVSNILSNVPYTFEIINCLKTTSMYSKGMQPVMYSVCDALAGKGGWVRAGEGVCYYRNLYTPGDDAEVDETRSRKRGFYSIRFNITFCNNGDICYFAYHFPYTYSFLKTTISSYASQIPTNLYYSNDVIGESLGGNPLNLLTITAQGSRDQVSDREVIFLSSRVHPGESNSSWMMHGVLETLLTSADTRIEELRSKFVFKIVPILNPDGVINGSHRCSLSGLDLNRVWDKPSKHLHPEIYHTKAIIQYMCDILKRTPFVFVDLHGHSRRANVFMFGNNPEESWREEDKTMQHGYEFMILPEVMEQKSPAFAFNLCQFAITRGKESSARVTVWRQFGVNKAYTMESTYSGFETGAYKGFQISTKDLKEIGRDLLLGILEAWKLSRQPRKQNKTHTKKKTTRAEASSVKS